MRLDTGENSVEPPVPAGNEAQALRRGLEIRRVDPGAQDRRLVGAPGVENILLDRDDRDGLRIRPRPELRPHRPVPLSAGERAKMARGPTVRKRRMPG